jgi:hypothetical protein
MQDTGDKSIRIEKTEDGQKVIDQGKDRNEHK